MVVVAMARNVLTLLHPRRAHCLASMGAKASATDGIPSVRTAQGDKEKR